MKCGIDIVDTERIGKLVGRQDPRKLRRIWTERELADCTDTRGSYRIESLAARYACKEAVAKALGTGFGRRGIAPCEIEIVKDASGEPSAALSGKTRAYFEQCGFGSVSVSLTHSGSIAAAICILS